MNRNFKIGILSVLIYFLATGISYLIFSPNVFSNNISSPVPDAKIGKDGQVIFDQTLPKTEVCPLNGEKYSKQQRQWWEKHRPLGVMIENHVTARPQSGLSYADVVYEAVAEGGITRFLTVFYCQDAGQIGPVRSARTYFLDFISEYGENPLYAHVGGANTPGPADALGQIEEYGWGNYNDMNQFAIGFPVFWRDYNRLGHETATEHTMYSTTVKLWEYAATKRKLTNVNEKGDPWNNGFQAYSFKDDLKNTDRPTAQKINLTFWEGDDDYTVAWTYDNATNTYQRINGGKPFMDKNNDKQVTAKNIVVLKMVENRANDGYEGNLHLVYKNKGKGTAIVYQDGKKITGTWKKDSREDRTQLLDNTGEEIKFNRGQIWFEILPTTGIISDE